MIFRCHRDLGLVHLPGLLDLAALGGAFFDAGFVSWSDKVIAGCPLGPFRQSRHEIREHDAVVALEIIDRAAHAVKAFAES
jgi:hypothetical protein